MSLGSSDSEATNRPQSYTFPPPPTHPTLRRRSPPLPTTPRTAASPECSRTPRQEMAGPSPPHRPNLNIYASYTMPGSVVDLPAVETQTQSTLPEATHKDSDLDESCIYEEELSEVQLRELYDDEEIDRFLHLFAAQMRDVKEVRAPTAPVVVQTIGDHMYDPLDQRELQDEQSWVPPTESEEHTQGQRPPFESGSLSERIAQHIRFWLPDGPLPPPFSLKRMPHTAQRLYLALEPTYLHIASRLWHLAAWKDYSTSLFCCILYWFFWYQGLLLTVFFLRILYALIRRKIFPYPSLAELRQHRKEIEHAESFSSMVSTRLATSSSVGVMEVWGLVRDLHKIKKSRASNNLRNLSTDTVTVTVDAASVSAVDLAPESIDPSDSEDPDFLKVGLFLCNQIADLHERARNLFLWRRPLSSVYFGIVLLCFAVIPIFPAYYLAKLAGLVFGVFFWHVIPVLSTMPLTDLSRLSSTLSVVPTDAEYAMELISQRVARGLDIEPKRRKYRHNKDSSRSESDPSERGSISDSTGQGGGSGGTPVNWQKLSERAAKPKAWASQVKGVFKDGQWKDPETWRSLPQLTTKVSLNGRNQDRVEAHTFPAQCKSPGLLTLTSTTLLFTSLGSVNAKISIDLKDITGVRKNTGTHGLRIRWRSSAVEAGEQEEKFNWVGNRDELFARLVGLEGRRWVSV